MTRRTFFVRATAAAAMPASAAAFLAAIDAPAATTRPADAASDSTADGPDLPSATLLSAGEAPAYLLVFHTGQHVMKGLLAFAKKHDLVAGHVAGIGADVGGRAARPDPEGDDRRMLHEQQRVVDFAGDARPDQRLLALDALGVADPPEPLDDQPTAHTAAGSKCSIRSLTSAMN